MLNFKTSPLVLTRYSLDASSDIDRQRHDCGVMELLKCDYLVFGYSKPRINFTNANAKTEGK